MKDVGFNGGQAIIACGKVENSRGTVAPVTFGHFSRLWFGFKRDQGLAKSTLDNYKSSVSKYLLPTLGRLFLEEIRWEHINKIIQQSKENGLGAGRLNFNLRILKQMLTDAVEFDFLAKKYLPTIKPVKESPKSLNYWLPEQAKRFLRSNVGDPLYALYVVALNTGLRRGELLGLCWDKVNLKNRRIEVSRIRDRYGLRDTTKTGKVRYVPLNKAARSALRAILQERGGNNLVFNLNGKTLNAEYLSTHHFQKAVEAAGVPRIRFHDLRTTYASNYAMAGGDIYALSRLLGHSSVDMTTKKYAGLHSRFMEKAAEIIQLV